MTVTIFIWLLTFFIIAISANGIIKIFQMAKKKIKTMTYKNIIKEDSLNADEDKY